MIIDSHQHFWNYNPVKHDWIDEQREAYKLYWQEIQGLVSEAKNNYSVVMKRSGNKIC